MNIVKQAKGNQLELVEKVDKDLIGGFILRVGDEQVDTSISKELRNLKNEFDDNLYIKEYQYQVSSTQYQDKIKNNN